MKFCHKCGSQTRDDASIFCHKCGTKFPPAFPEKEDVVCSRCGRKIADSQSVFCDKCGASLSVSVSGRDPGSADVRPAPPRAEKPDSCPACGTPVEDKNRYYCKSCGTYLKGLTVSSVKRTANQKKVVPTVQQRGAPLSRLIATKAGSAGKWVAICCGVVILLVAIYLGILGSGINTISSMTIPLPAVTGSGTAFLSPTSPTPNSLTVPMGQSLLVTQSAEEYKITVLEYKRGSEANQLMLAADPVNAQPDSGYEYLLVNIQEQYTKGEVEHPVSKQAYKIFANSKGYSPEMSLLPESLQGFDTINLLPGEQMEGWLIFLVPQSVPVKLSYEYQGEPKGFITIS